MDDNSKESPSTSRPRNRLPSSDDDFELLQELSHRHLAFSGFRVSDSSGYDGDDDDLELDFEQLGRESSPFRRRTFSQCDSPVFPLPELNIYDSEDQNEEEKSDSDHEKNQKKFMLEYSAWFKARRRVKSQTATLRASKSDGEMVNLSYCTDENKMSVLRSSLFRRLSLPPISTAEAGFKQKRKIHKLFQRSLLSGIKSKRSGTNSSEDLSSKTKTSSEKTGTCFVDVDKTKSSTEESPDIAAEGNLGKTKSSSSIDTTIDTEFKISPTNLEKYREKTDESYLADVSKSESFTSSSNSFNKSDSLTSTSHCLNKSDLEDSNESFPLEIKSDNLSEEESMDTKSSSGHPRVPGTEICSEKPKSFPEDSTIEAGCSTVRSEESRDELPERSTENTSTPDSVSSAEYRITSWTAVTGVPHSPDDSTDSSVASFFPDDKQKSPPRITSDPPLAGSSIIKVPTKRLVPSKTIPELSNLEGTFEDSYAGFKVPIKTLKPKEMSPELSTSPRAPKHTATERNLGETRESTSVVSLVTKFKISPASSSVENYPEKRNDFSLSDNSKSDSIRSTSESPNKSDLEDSSESCSFEIKPNVPLETESMDNKSSSEYTCNSSCSEIHSEKSKCSPENAFSCKAGRSSVRSEGSRDELSKYFVDSSSTPDTVNTPAVETSLPPLKSTPGSGSEYGTDSSVSSYSVNDSERKSPPQITSAPPLEGSGVLKVPTKHPVHSEMTSELSNLPGTSKDSDAVFKVPAKIPNSSPKSSPEISNSQPGTSKGAANNNSSPRRPTDLYVSPRSRYYTFYPRSPTDISFRPRSLPNFCRPPVKNFNPRSYNLDEPSNRGVIRSLFTGNYLIDGCTPRSGTSAISAEAKSAQRKNLGCSGEESRGSSEKRAPKRKPIASDSKSKVCKKLFASPSTKETNVTETFQDGLSFELIGDLSNLNIRDSSHPPEDADASGKDTTPKRKETSPLVEEGLSPSAKKVRLSKLDPEAVRGKEIEHPSPEEQSKDVLQSLSPPATGEIKTSPKRKIEDVEHGSQTTFPDDDRLPESPAKRTKIKPPTLVDETDTRNLPELEGEKKFPEESCSPGKISKDFTNPPNTGESTIPKRKIEDVEHGRQMDHPDDSLQRISSKRTKIKPPTPVDETDSEKSPESEKKTEHEDNKN